MHLTAENLPLGWQWKGSRYSGHNLWPAVTRNSEPQYETETLYP